MHYPIYLFRHGETAWNAERRAQGHLDSPLTAAGRAQARAMGETLAEEMRQVGYKPSGVIVRASPLGRVRETLAIAAEAAGLAHDDQCFDHRLREMSWGDWDGLNGAEIEAGWPGDLAARRLDHWNYQPPRGESYVMAVQRAQPALDDIAALAVERPVAVFAHGGIGRVLRGLFLRVPDTEILTMDQPQDAFYRLHKGAATRIGTSVDTEVEA
ncbi:MAG: histidine phosphatase family protein [Reyranella sp.]|uniref:histidine phosphatase family protein n=1 Tax=Reyranella sp. TaxID=1929291 RepID=UPI00273117CF|nr:histidine phosphatase family protein [Reyranella sp.]MDP1962272.1 histidine phosphatase family protein [Reyranella sp.]MDP2377925.1 histidine phosphatase family protein [Reyranella sp.]